MINFFSFSKEFMNAANKMIEKGNILKKAWLSILIWLAMAIWVLYSMVNK